MEQFMGDGFLDIILFAMIAAFLVLRLRSVLGRRTGHERPPPDPTPPQRSDPQANDNVVELPDRSGAAKQDEEFVTDTPEDPLSAGLTQVRIADNSFNPEGFLDGGKSAFEMIVQSFAAGDVKTLRAMLNDEVYDNFSAAVNQREEDDETLETTIIGIKKADIIEARVDGRMAFVTVKFLSEQVNVTRDKDGEAVDGDPNRITEVTDIWTFARDTKSRDPNWALVETSSPN